MTDNIIANTKTNNWKLDTSYDSVLISLHYQHFDNNQCVIGYHNLKIMNIIGKWNNLLINWNIYL